MTDKIDLGELPPSPYGDGVWLSITISDRIAMLTRLHEAICKWGDITNQEMQAFSEDVKHRRNSVWDDHNYDPVQEETDLLSQTERTMFASLSVSITSVVENFVIGVCQFLNVNCEKVNGMTDFGVAIRCLGCKKQIMLGQLPGYHGSQRARMLANCLKHNDGKMTKKVAEQYFRGCVAGTKIEYESENWKKMIEDTKTLLEELCKLL